MASWRISCGLRMVIVCPYRVHVEAVVTFRLFRLSESLTFYNYLLNFAQYDHTTLRNYYKMEGYTMFQDGFVLDVWTAAQLYPSQTFHQVALRLRKRVKLYPFHLCFVLLPTVAGTAAPSTMFRRHYCTRLRYASMLFTSCCTPHVTFDCSATWRIHIPD